MRVRRSAAGFTLIELMMVVAILGILASVAIPTFVFLVARSKTSEVSANLNALFKASASYYSSERSQQGASSNTSGFCTVAEPVNRSPLTPGNNKQRFEGGGNFAELGFSVADDVYFAYGYMSLGDVCGHTADTLDLYTYYANGDLDNDGVESTFELPAGSDDTNTLYHARGMAVFRETE